MKRKFTFEVNIQCEVEVNELDSQLIDEVLEIHDMAGIRDSKTGVIVEINKQILKALLDTPSALALYAEALARRESNQEWGYEWVQRWSNAIDPDFTVSDSITIAAVRSIMKRLPSWMGDFFTAEIDANPDRALSFFNYAFSQIFPKVEVKMREE